ncbi:hypothetical protein Gohar_012190 [Gossypium harknessii]|uniref:Uncharacterized protein n=1 Tax=Gossypium harknessii TaxID=34285 RepID=A0A7J9GW91_9ROSI|nr:hypothetical protein [Gossypium harknessii]
MEDANCALRSKKLGTICFLVAGSLK